MLTSNSHLVSRISMSGAILPLFLYISILWSGTLLLVINNNDDDDDDDDDNNNNNNNNNNNKFYMGTTQVQ